MHTITLFTLIGLAAGLLTLGIIIIEYSIRSKRFGDEIVRPKDPTIDSTTLIRVRHIAESRNGWTGFLGE
jgi:hypothetical protein